MLIQLRRARQKQRSLVRLTATIFEKILGTWTSGPIAKIGSNPFSNLTFESKRVTIGGADLATVLDRKCRQ
jgi:hypothetical protein